MPCLAVAWPLPGCSPLVWCHSGQRRTCPKKWWKTSEGESTEEKGLVDDLIVCAVETESADPMEVQGGIVVDTFSERTRDSLGAPTPSVGTAMRNLRIDRRRMLKSAAVVGALAALGPAAAFAKQGDEAEGVEGSWFVTVTPARPGQAPFQGLWSFARGGVLLLTHTVDRLAPGGGSASPEHGAWVETGERDFGTTSRQLLFDQKGNFQGTLRVRAVGALNEASDAFSGSARVDGFDPSGRLRFSTNSTFGGTRMRVESVE